MTRMKGLLALLGVLTVVLATRATAGTPNAKAALAHEATVELAQAVTSATSKTKGRPIEIELAKKKGKVVWEVEILAAKDHLMEVDVDAKTGDVIDSEAKP
jgi:uncharacterized membrane protein YkoI